jgi:hypothetical protein
MTEGEIHHEFTNNGEETSDDRHQTSAEKEGREERITPRETTDLENKHGMGKGIFIDIWILK